MATLFQELPEKIKRLEASHGPNNPFVKMLKEELRAIQETGGKSTQEVFRMQAFEFKPKEDPAVQAERASDLAGETLDLQNLPEDPALAANRAMPSRSKKQSTSKDAKK